jgi:molybdopterin/thiamine biosynthesis adenylyltransferase
VTDDRSRFYAERDRRTLQYGANPAVLDGPFAVHVGEDAAATRAGQVTVLALVNMLARVHRRLVLIVPDGPLLARSLVSASDLPTACVFTAKALDPFIDIELGACRRSSIPGVGVGAAVAMGLDYYLGADRFTATLATDPVKVADSQATVLGGGLAACLGAAALFRVGHGHRATPRRLSLWDFTEGDHATSGPEQVDHVDVGDVLVVGAGAVGSALCYWLGELGVTGDWSVVDGDPAELHNINRTIGLVAADTGWPDSTPANKAVAATRLLDLKPFPGWYHEWLQAHGDARPDLVLPLANDYGVRHAIGQRGENLLLHATTSNNWTAELHRHIAGRDDCIDCRIPEKPQARFACSTGPAQPGPKASSDAALPFLSGTAGLLLAAGLIRLQHGTLQRGPHNHWRLHLELGHRTFQRSQHHCREGCAQVLDESIRRVINAGARWAELS